MGGFPPWQRNTRVENTTKHCKASAHCCWKGEEWQRGAVLYLKRMGVGVSGDDKETLGWPITDRAGRPLTEGTTLLWGSCSAIANPSSSSSSVNIECATCKDGKNLCRFIQLGRWKIPFWSTSLSLAVHLVQRFSSVNLLIVGDVQPNSSVCICIHCVYCVYSLYWHHINYCDRNI